MAIVVGDHWASFGDGNMAQIINSREFIKPKNGIKYTKFILLPSRQIVNMYDLSEEIDKSTGFIVREYQEKYVVWLERGVYRSRCWIFPDFNGGPTKMTRYYQDLTETLTDTERLLKSAEAAKARAYQELEMERLHQAASLRLKTDMVREVARARGRVDGEEQGPMGPEQE